MRADRLLSIMLNLQVHRRLTARELARKLEVCERTIHRDMEALSTAGVPVVAERGTRGGWMLMEGYRTNLTGLNDAETQTLFLLKPSQLLADLGLHKASDAALVKMLAALPALSRHSVEYARQRLHVDVTGWNRAEESFTHLHTLQEAIWQERKIFFVYGQSAECMVERLADPLGLVAKGSVWYLVAAVEDAEVRSYRVSRIQDVRVTDQPCVRPANFNLADYWQESSRKFKAHLPRYRMNARVHPSILPRLRYAGRFAHVETGETDKDGWVRVSVRFDVEEMACEYALSFGAQLEVLEPHALREKVIKMAQSVISFYTNRDVETMNAER
jgi:predicted DNA-binding transcriptional regulator YafY